MKKMLSLAVALVATVMLGSSVFAAVTYSTTTYTGIADFTNAGNVAFTFTLKNVSGDATVSDSTIKWTSADAFVTGSTIAWVRADQYAVVAATVTKAGFNVYMFQDNKNNSSDYKATTGRTNADNSKAFSGLVRKGSNGGDYRGYIPVAYSFVGTKQANITYSQATSTTSATRADRYFGDVSDTNAASSYPKGFGAYTKIASIVGPVFGVDDNTGDWTGSQVTNHTAYMYFFGGFANVQGGSNDIYKTEKLYVVQVTE